MGYCSRCGEICGRASTKCLACGGMNQEPSVVKVLSSNSPRGDKWSSRYTRDPSQSPSPACTPVNSPRSPVVADTPASARKTLAKRDNLPSFPSPLPQTPSRAKVRSSKLYPSSMEETPSSITANIATTTDIPRLQPAGKDLLEFTRVFGSLLDPEQDRNRWKCHECQQVFIKDETIYPHPNKSQGENTYFCRSCFIANFSKGNCQVCSKAVLGEVSSSGELTTVKFQDKLWHKDCCLCTYCRKSVSENPTVGLHGELVCESCFDTAAWIRRPTATTPKRRESVMSDKTSSPKSPSNNNNTGSNKQTHRFSPSIAQLRKTFQQVGLESSSPAENREEQKRQQQHQRNISHISSDSTGDEDGVEANPFGHNEICTSCSRPLYSIAESGQYKIVRIPTTGEKYHARCFCCAQCEMAIGGDMKYVELPGGEKYHESCFQADQSDSPSLIRIGRPTRVVADIKASDSNNSNNDKSQSAATTIQTHSNSPRRRVPRTSATFSYTRFAESSSPISSKDNTTPIIPEERERIIPRLSTESSVLSSRPPRMLPKFGGLITCPACKRNATWFETVLGPSGSRMHPQCLICHLCKISLDANAKLDENKMLPICRACLHNAASS